MIIFKLCFLFLVQDSSSKKFLVETVDEYFDTSPPPYGEQAEDPVEPVAPIHRGKGVCQSTLPCQDEAHKQALSGESSLLFMEDKAVKLKLTSPGVLTFGDQKLPGSKGVDFSMLGMPSQPIDHDC
ncbi:uncharacterized protein LOC111713010 isoform X5 [Eurytemora carolleeae]|uniref:uncharacterized protein LOC111713010 isoform X5 n=1 Tax=Eurytemora carolleeae TaxID=1294199 RepID=UPI000C793A00|nr:uncharacterized protein LOC111713010 isoform X5 [Eurytemora carolleeae]|eukprot:XP_023343559.1 uncharacterized protein LOC111713010 isoform X5 [Eurytemora affinis]